MDKTEEKPTPSITQHQHPSFLSEMKVVLGKQGKIGDAEGSEGKNKMCLLLLRLFVTELNLLNVTKHTTE